MFHTILTSFNPLAAVLGLALLTTFAVLWWMALRKISELFDLIAALYSHLDNRGAAYVREALGHELVDTILDERARKLSEFKA